MAKANPIEPFPADIDRDAFGHYLAGFTDGEGCFGLNVHTYNYSPVVRPCAAFTINLRADDIPILRLIRSYFGFGTITRGSFNKTTRKNQWTFRVTTVSLLVSSVIPHFERFPLRAKKSRDFLIWREGVVFIQQVITSPRVGRPGKSQPQHWTRERLEHFLLIRARLKEQRQYVEPAV
jgi:hypothetical protein